MATSLHRILQTLLDLPAPCYHHHVLVRDASGQKLSKSLRAKPLRTFRQDGLSVEAVLARIAVPTVAMGDGLGVNALNALMQRPTVAEEP
jgi:glutamyl-Q tRNA(Asp) synthetase